ncbi:MFS transporter [Streptomyces sp. NPDC020412]|uniref:MFS transporter n=1 Tax=Streptomyces sp. NPDC020412 TaxID=3365073 RepID=UPI00379A8936
MTQQERDATGTVTTAVPDRLDRLPWSRWHWMVVVGLGTVWILDGLEVTVVGSIASRISQDGSGLTITDAQVTGVAAALYVAGACSGALFIGQAFLYNAITFGFGSILVRFFDVPSGSTGYYFAVIALGNFLGPLLLGHLFDTWGRRPMIAGTYLLSGLLLFGTAALFGAGELNAVTMSLCWCVVLFFASAGASSAYLTVSEVFPMETRAMSIAFFYAVGTAAGGITGPLVFAGLTESGVVYDAVLAFGIGAALMVAAGLVAAFFAVAAEGRALEDVARPLSVVPDDDRPADGSTGRPITSR